MSLHLLLFRYNIKQEVSHHLIDKILCVIFSFEVEVEVEVEVSTGKIRKHEKVTKNQSRQYYEKIWIIVRMLRKILQKYLQIAPIKSICVKWSIILTISSFGTALITLIARDSFPTGAWEIILKLLLYYHIN